MLRLLERNVASIERRLMLLAPAGAVIPDFFANVSADEVDHARLVREMQQMRGSIYLSDGAVQQSDLSTDGRHRTPEDDRSWHLLMLGKDRRVNACAWYLEHEDAKSIEDLRVRNCPLAKSEWRETLDSAVKSELKRAQEDRLRFAEVGGWAVAKHSRCTSEGLLLALAAYSLGRAFGGALGLTTATVRHASSTILRRLGGSNLEIPGAIVPPYHDPKYRCQMELLRFDSRHPNPKYDGLVEMLRQRLANVAVVSASVPAECAA